MTTIPAFIIVYLSLLHAAFALVTFTLVTFCRFNHLSAK